jgi:hypothetical protein
MQKLPKKPVKRGLLPQEHEREQEKNRADKEKTTGAGTGWNRKLRLERRDQSLPAQHHGPIVLIYRAIPMPEVGAMQKPGAVSRPGLGTLLKDISLCLPRVSMSRATCKNWLGF